MRRDLLTTPTIGSGGNVIGRPRKFPPPDAAERIQALATEITSIRGVALKMGTSAEVLRRWMQEDAALQEAFDNGRALLEQKLVALIVRDAEDRERPNVNAFFLLKNLFGYREGNQGDQGSRVNITFNLPGAMSREEFMKTVVSET